MSAEGPITRAVRAALRDAPLLPRDTAAVALAKRYAALLDDAAPDAKYGEPLRLIAAALPMDDQVEKAFRKVADALAQHSVASDLGPKLLAVLASLGMTPAGRGVKGGAQGGPAPVASKLDELRARRERRPG